MSEGYDRDAIESARREGMFDSDFDPMVLGLSDGEKQRMAKGLGNAAASMEGNADSRGTASGRKKKKNQRKASGKEGLLHRFFRWLTMLFTGVNREEYELRQRLKELRKHLSRIRPAVYSFPRKTVLPALAYQIYALYSMVSSFSRPFSGVFELSASASAIDFQLFFLQRISDNPAVGLADEFSTTSIGEKVGEDRELNVRKQYENIIHEFLSSFDEEEKKHLDRVYNEIRVFRNLVEFRFTRLLQLFGWDQGGEESGQPSFTEADAVSVVEGLRELEKVLLSLNLKYIPEVLKMGIAFFRMEILPGLDPGSADSLNKFFEKMESEGFRPFISAVVRLLKDKKLTTLIAFITRNPGYETHIIPEPLHFFSDLARELNSEVDRRIKDFYKQKSRREIDSKLETLFGSNELQNRYTYSEATNRHLKQFELPVFLYPVPFVLSLRFLEEKYFHHQKRLVNKLLVNGSFRNSLTRRMIADEFYRLDEINEEFQGFASFVDPKTDKGGQLVNMINNYNGDMPSKKALSNRIAEINHALHAILKKVQSSMQNLHIALTQIVRDIRNPNPETIDNLSTLSGAGNKKFLADLNQALQETELYCSILSKMFVTSMKGTG